jgi:8-oxo-dGTP diphosphatase
MNPFAEKVFFPLKPTDRYPIPVVRLILRQADGRVLILRRANTKYAQGEWCLPGGKVDYGATVEQTIIRELEEETALKCLASRFLFFQDSIPLISGDMHCLNLYFKCDWTGEVRLNEESSEYAWVRAEDFGRYPLAFNNGAGLRQFFSSVEKELLFSDRSETGRGGNPAAAGGAA